MIAEVNGEIIRMDDIKSAQMHESMEQLFRMQLSALKSKALEKLAEKRPEVSVARFRTSPKRTLKNSI